jgi:FAD:protein FMN transferase
MPSSCRLAGDSEAGSTGTANAPTGQSLRVEFLSRGVHAIRFPALGCSCEVLVHGADSEEAFLLGESAACEAWRIERKFSRYRDDSVTAAIHRARGESLTVDEETAALLNFARHCYELSDGLFDITSGVLRRVWTFDGSDRVPEASAVEKVLPLVGFCRLRLEPPFLMLPEGMELDFGGIGKEYAVDRAFAIVKALTKAPFLVNFGGDLRASQPPDYGPWQVGVERPGLTGAAVMLLDLSTGALATSGDSHRFLIRNGVRYGHVLDPRTGWPVSGGPRSVTVAAASCTEAGMWATLALLKGKGAAEFLRAEGRIHWIIE